MSPREFIVLIAMCLVWGFHFVVIKTAVSTMPPIFYAAVRMTLVAVLMSPFLRWRPGQMKFVLLGGLCFGAINYPLMFYGVKLATASTAAIAMELYVPFATIMSIIFLGDRLGWRRILGIAAAFTGVAIIALGKDDSGGGANIGLGVGLVAAGAFSESVGSILVKRASGFKPFELLAWFSVVGTCGLWAQTLLMETGQIEALISSDRLFVIGAILYSAIGASIFGHSAYYWLLQRLPVSVVAPSVLLTTMFAVLFSVVFLGDPFGPRIILGGLLTLAGVGFVLLRSAKKQDIKAPLAEPGVTP